MSVGRLRLYRSDAMERGCSNACNMWFEDIEVLVNSSSSAVEHRSSYVQKNIQYLINNYTVIELCVSRNALIYL